MAGNASWSEGTDTEEKACCAVSASYKDCQWKEDRWQLNLYTDKRSQKAPTRSHSSSVSWRLWIFLRFSIFFSCRPIWCTKSSTILIMIKKRKVFQCFKINYLSSIFCPMEHYICWTPPNFHIKQELESGNLLFFLHFFEKLLSLRRWSGLDFLRTIVKLQVDHRTYLDTNCSNER
jgi:hypothetical protein